ncbi:hypothetical protein [Halobacillus karajensis]
MELTVMAHNDRAIHFYSKMGFETEGLKNTPWLSMESR